MFFSPIFFHNLKAALGLAPGKEKKYTDTREKKTQLYQLDYNISCFHQESACPLLGSAFHCRIPLSCPGDGAVSVPGFLSSPWALGLLVPW